MSEHPVDLAVVIEHALARQVELINLLGAQKRLIADLRKQCTHPESTTDGDRIVTCNVCKAILPGEMEWLR